MAKLQAKLYRAAVYAGAVFSMGVLVLIVGYILFKGINRVGMCMKKRPNIH